MKTGLVILLAAMFISGLFVAQGALAADGKQGVKDAAGRATSFGSTKTIPE